MMDRKEFIKSTILAGAGAAIIGSDVYAAPVVKSKPGRTLNAYYFRGHMYTMVPRQVKEDLKWMADVGTNIVSLAILEQDLFAAVENIEIICNEAAKLGMDVWAVPSRWAGLVAGAPKVPSLFTVQNHETWMRNKDNSFVHSAVSGRISSIFHPATADFMKETANKVFETWDIKGLIWDEIKSLKFDYHEIALKKLGKNAPFEAYVDANVDFYSEVNASIKANFPDKEIGLFIQSNKSDMIMKKCATISDLDIYGCDGRPWGNTDGGKLESHGKVLLDGVGQRFIDTVKANNKKSLWLIENHNMADADLEILKNRLPEVIDSEVDHLIYYYYPRNLQRPDSIMNVTKNNLKKL